MQIQDPVEQPLHSSHQEGEWLAKEGACRLASEVKDEKFSLSYFYHVDNSLEKVDLQIYSDEPCPLHRCALSVPLVMH